MTSWRGRIRPLELEQPFAETVVDLGGGEHHRRRGRQLDGER